MFDSYVCHQLSTESKWSLPILTVYTVDTGVASNDDPEWERSLTTWWSDSQTVISGSAWLDLCRPRVSGLIWNVGTLSRDCSTGESHSITQLLLFSSHLAGPQSLQSGLQSLTIMGKAPIKATVGKFQSFSFYFDDFPNSHISISSEHDWCVSSYFLSKIALTV